MSESKTPERPVKRRRTPNPVPAAYRIPRDRALPIWEKRFAEAVDFDNGFPDEPDLHCILDMNGTQNGYPYVSWHHKEANVQLSHLALLFGTGAAPQRKDGETASHLCHNKRCIRPEHLIVESIADNAARNGCVAFVECHDCGNRVPACPHTPPCLLPWKKGK
mmetsp:Transcript_28934/g.94203  ORF Transcript_28934/g.94203 Transcript_28934/m.94203 type:complete len:163 (+) Transcript_28934:420-908(+)